MRPSTLSPVRLILFLFVSTLLVAVMYSQPARTSDGSETVQDQVPEPDGPTPVGEGAPPSTDHLAEKEAPTRHTVRRGETLFGIARRYGLSVADLQAANGLIGERILEGQVLQLERSAGDPVLTGALFQWPVVAPVSSQYGPRWGRHHDGIDLAANMGTPIQAARDGKVILAGEVKGYGNTVILEHADGSRTLYGHCESLKVMAGQRVTQGETIATVGSTGNSTGPHLHFEIQTGNEKVDPLRYLPPR